MSLQAIWNFSSQLSINKRKLVGIQFTRNQDPKTDLSVTKDPWRFTLQYPGRPWNLMRSTLESLDALDRYQPQTIQIGQNTNFAWLYRYLGDATSTAGFTVSSFVGNQLVLGNLTGVGLTAGEYVFRAGDLVQIGTGSNAKPYPYTIVNDVVFTGAATVTCTTHRPNIISTSVVGFKINVGPQCLISVFCPNMPSYTLTPGAYTVSQNTVINNAIVQFDDAFQLYEWTAQS
jgi:hypothetical protein